VTNRRVATVSVIDVWELQLEQQVTVGRSPISVAYSHLSGAVYVSNEEGGTVAVLDDTSHQVTTTITAEPGIGALRFEPRGRLAFLVSRNEDVVHILDSATNRIIQTVDVGPHPDQVTFTETLAYVRSRGSELVLMIPLDQVGREGDPVPIIDFSGGQLPFGDGTSVADGIVAAPGGVAALVANPADGVIYYYREGMAAPMGSFQNYGRRPRAVMAIDRSLEEIAPGVYSTDVNLPSAGEFDVPFFMDTPRIIHCFSLEVASDPGIGEAADEQGLPLSVEPLFGTAAVPVGEPFPMRFRVTRPETEEPVPNLADLGVLAFNTRGWQRRTWATSVGDGVYQTTFTLPRSGTYFISIQCPSEGLRTNDMRPLIVLAEDAAPTTSDTETAE
jgi:YVTN family beta-propeller protein